MKALPAQFLVFILVTAVAAFFGPLAAADDLSSGGGWAAVGANTNFGVVGGAFLSGESDVGTETNSSGIVYALFLSAGIPQGLDSDGDGMTDAWEFERGLDHTVDDAALDSDGDGLTNIEEFIAGTFPRDATSAFRVGAVSRTDSGMELEWYSILGRTYTIEKSTSLAPGSWATVTTVVGMDCAMVYEVPLSPPPLLREYYRVIVSNP